MMTEMRLRMGIVLFVFAAGGARAADPPPRLLALAVDGRLTLMIGKFDGGRWVQSTDFYKPPEPGDVFTLYGPGGAVGEAAIAETRRANPEATFAGWIAELRPRNHRQNDRVLAVSGPISSAPEASPLNPIPLDSPALLAAVSRYLKGKGLKVENPLLAEAFAIPGQGDGRDESIVVAQSDPRELKDDQAASEYAVALLCWNDHGKETTRPLESQTFFKPASQTVEDHRKYYGPLNRLRLLAAVDIDGDGRREIVLSITKEDAAQVDVFTFNGRRLKKVLSAYKPSYN